MEADEITTCFRHPGRETGRRCTRCERYACSDCLIQAAVGSQCVECVKAGRPPAKERVRRWNARQGPLVTKVIIGLNVVVYVLMAATANSHDSIESRFVLVKHLVDEGEWYRMITSGFVHFGLIHIGFNMVLLYRFGDALERALGKWKFTFLYFAALIGGSFGALLLSPNAATGGASGAVFGLMGATAIAMRQRGVGWQEGGVAPLIAINLVLSVVVPGISLGGHLGGLLVGTALGAVMLRPR
jgi:membrane associated rhomboid family serine protease